MRPGPAPTPRRQLAPEFRDAIRASGRPVWQLSVLAGLGRKLSTLLHKPFPATPWTLERLGIVADGLRPPFPRDRMLLAEQPDIAALAAEARHLLARALQAIAPEVALIDCAAAANAAIDEAAAGDFTRANAIQALLQAVLDGASRGEGEASAR